MKSVEDYRKRQQKKNAKAQRELSQLTYSLKPKTMTIQTYIQRQNNKNTELRRKSTTKMAKRKQESTTAIK
jgi:hypothetical protein